MSRERFEVWIIPKNLDVSHSVRDMVGSSWDLKELSQNCEQSLMWRSKPSLARTWLQRLKRVNWMQLLSGRILKPSMDSRFVTEYTSSLAVIPASHSQLQENDREQMTPDTFGRLYSNTFVQLDLFGASSRTLEATLVLDSPKFIEAYGLWVTKLRQDSLQRQKSEHLTSDSDCLSWPTVRATDHASNGSQTYIKNGVFKTRRLKSNQDFGARLSEAIVVYDEKFWLTPTVTEMDRTPEGMEKRKAYRESIGRQYVEGNLLDQVNNGQPDQANPNTTGKSRGQLNPAWVEQLMGLKAGWTNFDYSEMESSPNVQN